MPSLPHPNQEQYLEFSRIICEMLRTQHCEHIWAEVINVRGPPTMPSKMPDSLLQLFQGKTAYSRTTLEQTGIPLNIQPHEYTLSSLSWSSLSWTSAICPPRWAYASAVQKTMAMFFRNEPTFPYRDEHGLPSDRFDTIFAR
jgi:hypothetical protein